MASPEMNEEIDDDIMDEGVEFVLPEHFNVENDNEVLGKRKKQTTVGGGDGLVANKRAECWNHFHLFTDKGNPKPRAGCNFCTKQCKLNPLRTTLENNLMSWSNWIPVLLFTYVFVFFILWYLNTPMLDKLLVVFLCVCIAFSYNEGEW